MGYHDYQLAKIIQKAIMEGKTEIKMPDGKVVELPAPQKRGPYAQRQGRAARAAIEIIEKWQSKKN